LQRYNDNDNARLSRQLSTNYVFVRFRNPDILTTWVYYQSWSWSWNFESRCLSASWSTESSSWKFQLL